MIDILVDTVVNGINDFIEKEGISRKEFAVKAGIEYGSLNNMLSKLNKKESFITMTTLKKIEKAIEKDS